MKLTKVAGATSEIWQVFIQDSSSTTGAGLAALAFNTGSLTAYYHRDTDTTATAITLVTMTVGTFTSSGFKEIDATNMPGWYQFCPPNAAIASGAKSCGFHLKGATNMAPLAIEVQLAAVNPDSATAFMTSVASVVGAVGSVTGAVGSVTGAVGSVTGAVGSVTGAVGSVTGNVGGSVASVTAIANNAITAAALAADAGAEIADAVLDRDMSTGTDSGSTTVRTPRQALRLLRNKAAIAGGTLTVKKEDDATTSWTATVATTAGDPVSSIDPAGP